MWMQNTHPPRMETSPSARSTLAKLGTLWKQHLRSGVFSGTRPKACGDQWGPEGAWDKLGMQMKYGTNGTTLNYTLCLVTNNISPYLREV